MLDRLSWPKGHLTVLVLVPYLQTVQRTFDALWTVAANAQPSSLLLGGIKSDPKHLWLARGITHKPGLRWEIIDLGAYLTGNEEVSPIEIRDTNSAHAGVLATAAHFPLWVRAMAGGNVPPVWIAGYHVRTSSFGGLNRTMHLGWRPPTGLEGCGKPNPGGMTLDASFSDERSRPWAGPIIKRAPKPLALGAGEHEDRALSA